MFILVMSVEFHPHLCRLHFVRHDQLVAELARVSCYENLPASLGPKYNIQANKRSYSEIQQVFWPGLRCCIMRLCDLLASDTSDDTKVVFQHNCANFITDLPKCHGPSIEL